MINATFSVYQLFVRSVLVNTVDTFGSTYNSELPESLHNLLEHVRAARHNWDQLIDGEQKGLAEGPGGES